MNLVRGHGPGLSGSTWWLLRNARQTASAWAWRIRPETRGEPVPGTMSKRPRSGPSGDRRRSRRRTAGSRGTSRCARRPCRSGSCNGTWPEWRRYSRSRGRGGAMDEVVLTPADPGAEQVAADVGTEEGIDVLGRGDDPARCPGQRRVDELALVLEDAGHRCGRSRACSPWASRPCPAGSCSRFRRVCRSRSAGAGCRSCRRPPRRSARP